MASPIDLERLEEGAQSWNAWANELLKRRATSEAKGSWERDIAAWRKEACTDFQNFSFSETTNFSGFIFPDVANFEGCTFSKDAHFDNAIFHSGAIFRRVHFAGFVQFAQTEFVSGDAIFAGAKFSSMANFVAPQFKRDANFNFTKFLRSVSFSETIFHKNATFQDCIFSSSDDVGIGPRSIYAATFNGVGFCGDVKFSRAHFTNAAIFKEATFQSEADFHSIVSEVSLSLDSAEFLRVPDFIEARLHAPLRLDNISIRESRPFLWSGDKESAARYRALKSIASEAQDHVQELNFFASELRERRGTDNKPLGKGAASFWLGFCFELFSDFGRSISRPLGWIVGMILAFSLLYRVEALEQFSTGCGWPSRWFSPELYLSVLHTLPGLGVSHVGRRELALRCLFGVDMKGAPNIGPGLDTVFLAHNVFAAMILFMLLLSIRNLFRIK